MANTIDSTQERILTSEAVETQKKETTKAEVCFGALMGVAAIAGLWGAVSLLISFFMNQDSHAERHTFPAEAIKTIASGLQKGFDFLFSALLAGTGYLQRSVPGEHRAIENLIQSKYKPVKNYS